MQIISIAASGGSALCISHETVQRPASACPNSGRSLCAPHRYAAFRGARSCQLRRLRHAPSQHRTRRFVGRAEHAPRGEERCKPSRDASSRCTNALFRPAMLARFGSPTIAGAGLSQLGPSWCRGPLRPCDRAGRATGSRVAGQIQSPAIRAGGRSYLSPSSLTRCHCAVAPAGHAGGAHVFHPLTGRRDFEVAWARP
jgi:hypothetical protein